MVQASKQDVTGIDVFNEEPPLPFPLQPVAVWVDGPHFNSAEGNDEGRSISYDLPDPYLAVGTLVIDPPIVPVGERVRRTPTPPPPQENMQMFEVVVPRGVRGGQPFALLAGQQRVLVTCPPHAGTGQKIRIRLPILLAKPPQGLESVRLSYDKDGWARNIRVSDMKFQWMRFDKQGDISQHTRFSADSEGLSQVIILLWRLKFDSS